ncbi:MAG: FtsQ-type POTRA domain-containing protein [Candidatus Neomarinimicrobiota bacterium]
MSRKKSKLKLNSRLIIGWTLFLTFILSVWTSFIWADYISLFKMGEIRITGASILEKKAYQELLGPLGKANFNEIKINDVRLLLESNPFVRAARVSRLFPNTLSIEIAERRPIAILNMDPVLLIDIDAVIMPDKDNYSQSAPLPVLSGFNQSKELYPPGLKTYSVKVKEAAIILKYVMEIYPELYKNLSEISINTKEEYELILANRPTRVKLGKQKIMEKIQILKQFELSLEGVGQLTDYKLVDMRYNRQVVTREWS